MICYFNSETKNVVMQSISNKTLLGTLKLPHTQKRYKRSQVKKKESRDRKMWVGKWTDLNNRKRGKRDYEMDKTPRKKRLL